MSCLAPNSHPWEHVKARQSTSKRDIYCLTLDERQSPSYLNGRGQIMREEPQILTFRRRVALSHINTRLLPIFFYKRRPDMGKVIRFAGILAGVVMACAWTSAFSQTGDCFNQLPGCLDPGFGVNGRVTVPSGMQVNGIAIQTVAGEERIG